MIGDVDEVAAAHGPLFTKTRKPAITNVAATMARWLSG